MLKKDFDNAVKCFDSVVQQEINNHKWLMYQKLLTASKIFMDGVLEDINFCSHHIGKRGGKVLDFGAGSGLTASLLAFLGYETKGIDIDDFAEYAEDISSDQKAVWEALGKKFSHLEFKHYKLEIPYPDNSFDAVVAYAVLEHIPDNAIPYVMQEIKRVLKDKGVFFIFKLPSKSAYLEYLAKMLRLGHHQRLYDDKEIKKLLLENSFDVIGSSLTGMVPTAPANIANLFYPFLKIADKILLNTPLRYFAHNISIACRNNK